MENLLDVVQKNLQRTVVEDGEKHIIFSQHKQDNRMMILLLKNIHSSNLYLQITKNSNKVFTTSLESKQDISNIKRTVRIFLDLIETYWDDQEQEVNELYIENIYCSERWTKDLMTTAQHHNFTEDSKMKLVNLLNTITSEQTLDWNGKSIIKLLWLMGRYRLNGTERLHKLTEAAQPKF
tara:strand:+ start:2538 stop:3077 length:540 start_codon:yes stop_codon:yes gene_type:complete